jgi:hypothetical protein
LWKTLNKRQKEELSEDTIKIITKFSSLQDTSVDEIKSFSVKWGSALAETGLVMYDESNTKVIMDTIKYSINFLPISTVEVLFIDLFYCMYNILSQSDRAKFETPKTVKNRLLWFTSLYNYMIYKEKITILEADNSISIFIENIVDNILKSSTHLTNFNKVLSKTENKFISNLKLKVDDRMQFITTLIYVCNVVVQKSDIQLVFERLNGSYFNAYKKHTIIQLYDKKELSIPGARKLKGKKIFPVMFETGVGLLIDYNLPPDWADDVYEEMLYDSEIGDLGDDVRSKIKKFTHAVRHSDTCVCTELDENDKEGRSLLITNETNRLIVLTYGEMTVGDNYRAGNIGRGIIPASAALKFGLDEMHYTCLYTTDAGLTHIYNYDIIPIKSNIITADAFNVDYPKDKDDDYYIKAVYDQMKVSNPQSRAISDEKGKDYARNLIHKLSKLGYMEKDVRYRAVELQGGLDLEGTLNETLTQLLLELKGTEASEVSAKIKDYIGKETNREAKLRALQMPLQMGDIIRQNAPARERALFREIKPLSEFSTIGFDLNRLLSGDISISVYVKENAMSTLEMMSKEIRSLSRPDALSVNNVIKMTRAIYSDLIVVDVGNHYDDLAAIKWMSQVVQYKTTKMNLEGFEEVDVYEEASGGLYNKIVI